MNQVTHTFGTQRKATVIKANRSGLVLIDDQNEGHIIFDKGYSGIDDGDVGMIEFTKGGPTGGYWKFKKA